MQFGQDVLSKIENLITQIDSKRDKYFRARKTRFDGQENTDMNSLYNKLYEEYKVKQIKRATKVQQKINEETHHHSPFKVTNKHSIFLNSQQIKKPIHERVTQLQNKKLQELIRLREKYPPRHEETNFQEEEVIQEMEERRRNQKKYTKRQLNEMMEDMKHKEKLRLEKLNRLKLSAIEQHSKEFRCKPYIGKQSQQMWNRYKMKKQLSTSVFQRFSQYQMDRRTHLENTQKQLKKKLTPFAPKISQNSKLIASRSASKSDLSKSLSKSASCRCFHRNTRPHNKSTAINSSRKN